GDGFPRQRTLGNHECVCRAPSGAICWREMIDEHTFIAMIRAHPFEWGPRLVYADWLEDQGESPRAELVRMLHRLYTEPPTDKHALIRPILDLSANGPLHAEPFYLNSIGVLMRHVE